MRQKLFNLRENFERGLLMGNNGFYHILPSNRFIEACTKVVEKMEKDDGGYYLNKFTFEKSKESKIAGVMGEYGCFKIKVLKLDGKEYVPKEWTGSKNYNYDWEYVDKSNSDDIIKIDVKTKKRQTVPDMDFDASIYKYQEDFDADYYIFASVEFNKEFQKWGAITYCGIASKEHIISGIETGKTKVWEAGSIDKSNGVEFKTTSYNIKYRDLISPRGVFYPYDCSKTPNFS